MLEINDTHSKDYPIANALKYSFVTDPSKKSVTRLPFSSTDSNLIYRRCITSLSTTLLSTAFNFLNSPDFTLKLILVSNV